MKRTRHPDPEVIALWVLEPGSEHLTAEAVRHLESDCPVCRAAAADLRRLADELPSALRGEPGPELLERCRSLVGRREETLLLVAELIEDTRELAGIRGESVDARYMLFRAGDFDIDLRIRGRGRKHEVRGQLHGPSASTVTGVRVRAVHDGRVLEEARTDSLGEFRISARSRLPYLLELVGGPVRICTSEITM